MENGRFDLAVPPWLYEIIFEKDLKKANKLLRKAKRNLIKHKKLIKKWWYISIYPLDEEIEQYGENLNPEDELKYDWDPDVI